VNNQCGSGANALQTVRGSLGNTTADQFIACFSVTCCRLWSTYYGGSANDIATGITAAVLPLGTLGAGSPAQDRVVVSGYTFSTDYPVISPAGAFNQTTMSVQNAPDATLLAIRFLADEKLPIELSSFGASVNTNTVQLNWLTASEDHNAGFELQRAEMATAYDQPEFKAIDSYLKDDGLVGLGTSPAGKSYNYFDNDPTLQGGKYYVYRLVDISTDGVRTEHPSIAVLLDAATTPSEPSSSFSVNAVVPNPASSSINLTFSLAEAKAVTIELYSTDGKKVATPVDARNFGVGSQLVSVPVSDLAPGVYTAVISTDNYGQVRTRQFVVVR
jgi:hypothetical protein